MESIKFKTKENENNSFDNAEPATKVVSEVSKLLRKTISHTNKIMNTIVNNIKIVYSDCKIYKIYSNESFIKKIDKQVKNNIGRKRYKKEMIYSKKSKLADIITTTDNDYLYISIPKSCDKYYKKVLDSHTKVKYIEVK